MEDHKKRYPDSERTFTPEGSDSLVTPEQSPTRPKKTPKQHGIPEVARHTSNRGQDQEVSDAESEASAGEEAAIKQRTARDIRGRSRKRSRWLIVGGRKRQDIPHDGDRDRRNGNRRSSQGPDSRTKTGAQAQDTNEALIDTAALNSGDTRKCGFLLFPNVLTS